MKFLPSVSFLELALPRILNKMQKSNPIYYLLFLLFILPQLSMGQCGTCSNNLITNPGFDVNVNSWASFNGNFYRNTSFPQCGTTGHAEMQRTSSWAGFYQEVSNIPVGSVMTLTFWAGVHDPAANSVFGFEYYNGNTYLSESTIQIDKILGGTPSMQYYTMTGFVPANCNKVRVIGKMDNGYLKADEVCLRVTGSGCNPNNSNAPPFCAPTPVCAGGNFLWSQTIDPSSGTMSTVRFVCGQTTTYTIPGPYPSALATASTVNISDVVSYDGYTNRNTVTQNNEKWRVVFKKNGTVVGTSPYTGDVPDLVQQGFWRGSLGTITLPNGADQVIIEHWSIGNGNNCNDGPNSVIPTSVCFSVTPFNQCRDFTSFVNTELNLVKTRTVLNQKTCTNQPDRVLYTDCLLSNSPTGGSSFWKIISGGEFKEYCDGTAYTTFRVQNESHPTYKFDVSVILSGRTYTAPPNSPKLEGCTTAATSDWYYYTNFNGSFIGVEGLAGANVSFSPMGPALQVGTNGSLYGVLGNFGASEWLTYKVITQPTAFNLIEGCQADFNFFLTGGALTQAQSTNCQSVCSGSQVTLNGYAAGGKPGYSYTWSNSLGSGTTKTVNVTGSGNVTYSITVTDNLGCTAVDNVVVKVDPNPSVDAGANASICNGQSIVLTANGSSGTSPYTYVWSNGSTSKNQNVTPTTTTTYSVTVSDAKGCTATDNVQITVFNSINLTATGATFCTGSSGSISANATNGTAPYTYTWSGGLGTGTPKTVTTAGTYIVTVSDANGCTKTASSVVTVNTLPTANAGANVTTTCTNPTAALTATGGGTYLWSTNATTASITVNPVSNTNYTVTVTSANGCTASDVVTVTVNKSITANAGADYLMCASDDLVYLRGSSTGQSSVLWTSSGTGSFANANSLNSDYTLSAADKTRASITFTLTASNSNCPSVIDTKVVSIRQIPNISLNSSTNRICAGDNISVVATSLPNHTYKWYGPNGFTSSSSTLSFTNAQMNQSGVYYLTVLDDNGCLNNVLSTSYKLLVDDDYCTTEIGNILQTTDWNTTINVKKFNGNCGALQSVNYKVSSIIINNNAFESFANGSGTSNLNVTGTINVNKPEGGTVALSLNENYPSTHSTYDGSIDFAGTSGYRKLYEKYISNSINTTQFGIYTGTGNVSFPSDVSVFTFLTATGGNSVFSQRTWAGADIVIHYCYASPLSVAPVAVCIGETATLTAVGNNNFPYVWTLPSGSTFTGNPLIVSNTSSANAGLYTVTQDGCGDCAIASANATLTINQKPTANAGADVTTTCTNPTAALTATGGGTYLWSTNATTASITVNPVSNTNYTVTVTSASGCTASDAVTVTVNKTAPTANAGADVTTTCTNPTAALTATGGGTYLWSTNATTASITVNPVSNTNYTVTVTAANGCTASDAVTVTVNKTAPTANAGADVTTTCTNPTAALTATGGGTYLWSTNATTASITVNPVSNTNYTVTVTSANGCTASDAVTVTVNKTAPTANAGADVTTTCTNPTASLTATGGGTYLWSTNATTASITVNPVSNTNYTVTVTAANGCTATDAVTVAVNKTAPTANAGADVTTTCTNPTAALTATGGGTYLWSTNATTASITVNPVSNTNYTVTVTAANGCTASDVVTVTVNKTAPTANAGADVTTTCTNPTASLTATGGGTYLWSTNATTASITVNPVSNTNYTVTVTSANGCTASDAVTVTVNKTAPTANAGADVTTTCTNPTASLTATGGGTYLWSTNATTASITVNPVSNTNYTVTVTAANGCTATDAVTVAVNKTAPTANAGADVTTTCTNPTAALTATGGGTYLWSTNATTASITVNPVSNTNYTVTVTSANGCTASDVVTVTVDKTAPTANAGADVTTTCTNPTASLTATGGGTYLWSTNATTANITVNPVSNTNYTVTVTSANGCTASDVVTVTVNKTAPTANAGGNKIICNGEAVTLTATGNGTYLWSNNSTSSSIYVSPTTNTTYNVTVTATNGCTASSQAVVTVTPLPASGLTGPDQICVDEFGLFSANPPLAGATYAWTFDGGVSQDGDANDPTETIKWPNALQNSARTITLVVTKDGCSSTYTKSIFVKTGVFLNTTANYPVCQGGSVQIGPNPNDATAVNPGATFQWSPNLFLNSNSVAQPVSSPPFDITYTLTATLNGCAVSKQITVDVNVNLNPIANAGPDKTICISESVQIGGSPTATPPTGGAIAGVVWTPGNSTLTNPMVSPTTNQTYRVVVVATSGCADTDFVNVVVLPKGKIGDYLWSDTGAGSNSANGCQDADELGINGVTVKLFAVSGAEVATTTTTNNPSNGKAGYYQFEVCAGNYYVNFGKPTGFVFTELNSAGCNSDLNSDANRSTGNSPNVTLASGQVITNIDAGVYQAAKLGDYVWEDSNFNGLQEAGEPVIANVVVMLEDASGNVAKDINGNNVASTTTNAQGKYEFANLKPGVGYVVKFTKPSGFEPTGKDKGNDALDSDADLITGKSQVVTLTSGENNTTIDAGYYKLASIGDFVWEDKNGNGIQDAGEPGVGGLTVTLTGTKGDGTAVTLTTTTNATTGAYSFTSLMPGTYTVTFTKPNGDAFTTPGQGTDPTKDSNANVTTGASTPITLVSGENNTTIDAGILKAAKLGDYVWEDSNFNGLQEAGEPVIANVVVMLEDASGNVAKDINGNNVASTTTNAQGKYEFANLKPGVGYVVKFTKPNGFEPTGKDKGNDALDSDADLITGKSQVVTLTSGENNTTIDAGYYKLASIGDFVWEDKNGNGIQDAGEPGVGGLTVTLTGTKGDGTAITLTTTTNATTGAYLFANLMPGTYTVTFTKPNGDAFTTPGQGTDPTKDSNANQATGASTPITLVSGENNTTIDAGILKAAKLGDYVWEDSNFNGLQEAGEPVIANVVVMLEDASGNVAKDINGNNVASTTTNAQGKYEFANLKPGVGYVVKFTKPSGFEPTGKDKGNDALDSDADLITGKSQVVTLTSGENNTTIDAGYYKLASIGDFVWEDKNGNGIQDAGEPGVGGLTVTLTGTKGDGTAVTLTTTTNATTGAYLFANLMPGTYTVTFTKPNGDAFTTPGQGTDPTKDSNANQATGASTPITLVSGENNTTIDAGILRTAKLGDFVWEDLNLNGIQDSNEPAIPGVTVRLFNSDGIQIAFKNTGINGDYEFTNLSPGTYRVKFDRPIGYEPTGKNKGTDTTKDSNADLVTGMTDNIIIQSGDNNRTIDAGYYRLASIGDYVWEDRNANGIQEEAEQGIGNVTVNLTGTDALGNPVTKSTVTTNAGFYSFTNLNPGTYTVTFIKPGSTYKPSPISGTTDGTKDSNANPVDGKSSPVTLVSGENNTTIDAGFYRCAQVGDLVWLDQGLVQDKQDAGDVGLNGIVVELYSVSNPSTPVQTTTTMNNPSNPLLKGYYNFEVCGTGEFFIKVIKTAAYDYVQPNQGLDDGIDSDIIDFENQKTLNFTVNYAQVIPDIDAGLKLKPLPVQISEFTAYWNTSKDVNVLNWSTASEKNNERFEVERSLNGSQFMMIGSVKGSGNTSETVDYNFDDTDNRRNGRYTYRLRQVDFDGKFSYSDVRDVIVKRANELTTNIYPNPMTERVNIELTAPEGSVVSANIYDNTGKLVMSNVINQVMTDSYLNTTVNNQNLVKGVYNIVLTVDGNVSVHKLIVIE